MPVRPIIAVILVILLSYGIFKAIPLLVGPEIQLTSPKDGQSFPDGFVEVRGTSIHTDKLQLDGGTLLIDEKGAFSTTLVLPHGSAILSLTATDRFGKTETVTRSVFVP